MSSLFTDEELEREDRQQADTELTLSMATLLGAFFVLVMVCAIFFGLGYSIGHQVNKARAAAANPGPAAPPLVAESSPAPPARQPAPEGEPAEPSAASSAASAESTAGNAPEAGRSQAYAKPSPASIDRADPPQPPVHRDAAQKPVPRTSPPEPAARPETRKPALSQPGARKPAAAPEPAAPMVQVAAVTKSSDAEMLAGSLRRHGYAASVRTAAQDRLFHVQIGPFASRAEAQTVRQKLTSDGYNAILK
jgi:cell division septation protein DedD